MVFDFKSMYPSIIQTANISPETVHMLTEEEDILYMLREMGVDSDDASLETLTDLSVIHPTRDRIYVLTDGMIGYIDQRVEGVASSMMKDLVKRRSDLPDTAENEPVRNALKVGANSLYGALGSSVSGLGSRLGAAAVTAIGRHVIGLLINFITSLGYEVLYSDTDSVFVVKLDADADDLSPEDIIELFHTSLATTPYSLVRLAHEKTFAHVILIKPKMYFGVIGPANKHEIKGIASKRRDRPEIVRSVVKQICIMICTESSNGEKVTAISQYLYQTHSLVVRDLIDRQLCAKETRVNSTQVWLYCTDDYTEADDSYASIEVTEDEKSEDDANDPDPLYPASDWRDDAMLPEHFECMLPHRRNIEVYVAERMACSRGGRTFDRPELRYSPAINQIMIPRRFDAICGYPVEAEDGYYTLTYSVNDKSPLANMKVINDLMTNARQAWIWPKLVPHHANKLSPHYQHVIRLYREVPLHFATVLSTLEILSMREIHPVWPVIYDEFPTATAHNGVHGIIYDNALVNVRAYDAVDAKNDEARDLSRRAHHKHFDNFVSPMYTPASLDAGCTMMLCHTVQIRCITA
ncbi:hypothetical protein DFJ73DRAFT_635477, partial [Zopfochytrium polystomum]